MTGAKPDELIRTPMQWSDAPNAGFSTADPWEPPNDDFRTVNVAAQEDDADSLLSLYRRLVHLRTTHAALRVTWSPSGARARERTHTCAAARTRRPTTPSWWSSTSPRRTWPAAPSPSRPALWTRGSTARSMPSPVSASVTSSWTTTAASAPMRRRTGFPRGRRWCSKSPADSPSEVSARPVASRATVREATGVGRVGRGTMEVHFARRPHPLPRDGERRP